MIDRFQHWSLKQKEHWLSSAMLLILSFFILPQIVPILSIVCEIIMLALISQLIDINSFYESIDLEIIGIVNGASTAVLFILVCRNMWKKLGQKVHFFGFLLSLNAAIYCFRDLTKLPSFFLPLDDYYRYIGVVYLITAIEIGIYAIFQMRYDEEHIPNIKTTCLYMALSIIIVSVVLYLFVDFKELSSLMERLLG